MRFTERAVGRVRIFDTVGKWTLHSGSEELMARVKSVVAEGHRHVVLNLSECRYIDSSGLGDLVSACSLVHKAAGKLALCQLSPRLADNFKSNRLDSFFLITSTVEEAVAQLGSNVLEIACPLAGCSGCARISEQVDQSTHTCLKCGCRYSVRLLEEGATEATVTSFRIPTYEGEWIEVSLRQPCTVEVVGRFDLFVSESLEKAWQTVPVPRCVVFDLSGCTELSAAGIQGLVSLLQTARSRSSAESPKGQDRAVIVLPKEGEAAHAFPPGIAVFKDRDSAWASLGKMAVITSLVVTVRQQQ